MSRPGLAALAVVLVSVPGFVFAQEAVSFEDIQAVVKPDQRVVVTDAGGGKARGTVVDLSPSSITIRIRDGLGDEGVRKFDRVSVSTIRRSDRLWNGLLIGAGVGIAATEIWSASLCGPRGRDNECSVIVTGAGWLSFVPGGALVGALIDKAIGNHLIYSAAPTSRSFHLSPTISPARLGLTAAVRF